MDWSVRYVYVELNFILFLVHCHSRAPARIKIREKVEIAEEKPTCPPSCWENQRK